MKIMSANRIASDGTPPLTASHMGLICLPMSHKKDARLIWVNDGLFLNRLMIYKFMILSV